jgi:phospholipid N-methyltransferase
MCEHIDPLKRQVILELGAGSGAVTAAASTQMHPESTLIAVEVDPDLAEIAATRCPEAMVSRANVRDLPSLLSMRRITRIDLLLNCLPTPSLPLGVNATVLDTFYELSQGAWFSQLTVMPWIYQGMYRRVFEEVDFRLVINNVPPGGVYHCRRLRTNYRLHLPGLLAS